MATAFQQNAFQDNGFQIDEGTAVTYGISGGASYRYFTPAPPPLKGKKKKQIDRLVEQEARIEAAIRKYETSGVDMAVLEELARKLREVHLMILRMALESALASDYIMWKRQQEEEDIKFIISQI